MATGRDIVASGQTWVAAKVPYVWGGITKAGADCSGYVQTVLGGLGIKVGRTTYDQVKQGTAVNLSGTDKLANAQPGDILFFGSANAPYHEGIYIGNGQMIDEPHAGAVARQESVWKDLSAIRRFTPDSGSGEVINTQPISSVTSNDTTAGKTRLFSIGSYDVNLGTSGLIRTGVIVAGLVLVLVALHALTSNAATPLGVVGEGATGAGNTVGKVVRNKSSNGGMHRTAHQSKAKPAPKSAPLKSDTPAKADE